MLAHKFLPRVATDAREREVPSGARGDQQDSSVRVHLVACMVHDLNVHRGWSTLKPCQSPSDCRLLRE
jgi:hypothetical protein